MKKEYEKAYSNVDVGFGMFTDVLCAGICSKRRRIFSHTVFLTTKAK